jgi:hypothetical protein
LVLSPIERKRVAGEICAEEVGFRSVEWFEVKEVKEDDNC